MMNENLKLTIQKIKTISISQKRKEVLQPLIEYVQQKYNNQEVTRLNFICTHNSRRSHLSQVWAQTMAFYFEIPHVVCYSGGTEATALFPKVAETLIDQGFHVDKLSENTNPVYAVKFDCNAHPIICFSKVFDADFNPSSQFAAVMTCSSADEGCPFIAGAEQRLPIRYDDPKAFDGTELMDQKYQERSLEIASEMYYVFSKIVK
jgi:arsenate reductase